MADGRWQTRVSQKTMVSKGMVLEGTCMCAVADGLPGPIR